MPKFDVMFKDERVATVNLSNQFVKVDTYTDEPYKQPFLKKPVSIAFCKAFLKRRVISENSDTLVSTLKELNIPKYDVIDILRKTHGVDMDDFYWIRFDGDNICWNDINPRLKYNEKLCNK